MATRTTEAVRDAQLAAINTLFDGGALELRSGAPPASAASPATGILVANINPLPADAFAAEAGGQMSKNPDVWEDPTADNAGTIGYFLLRTAGDTNASTQTQARITGTVTAVGGGGDMEVDNTQVAAGQRVTIVNFTLQIPEVGPQP